MKTIIFLGLLILMALQNKKAGNFLGVFFRPAEMPAFLLTRELNRPNRFSKPVKYDFYRVLLFFINKIMNTFNIPNYIA